MTAAEESLNFRNEDIIPKERRNRSLLTARILLFILIILLFLFMFSSGVHILDYKHILNFVILHIAIKGIGGVVKGVCDFGEEFHHLKTRYSGKYTNAIGACVKKRPWFLPSAIVLPICFGEESAWSLCIHILTACIGDLLYNALGFQTPTQVDISKISELKHVNVAQGLAWSYYIGYLKIILPHFKDQVRNFNEGNANILRPADTCKLHILIPLSCVIYSDLSDADRNIQHVENLPSLSTDRAGIKGRNFKNSVYKIADEDRRPHYCIVEYATPLSSLYEMSNISSTAFSREDRIQQAKLFYRTLEHILETAVDSDYRHLCRLIPYDDCQENDQKERNSNFLSNLILKHIQQQKAEEYPAYES